MRIGSIGLRSVLTGAFLLLAALRGGAQVTGSPAQVDIPRTKEGKPDFSGIWQVMNTAAWDIQDHNAGKGVPAGIGVVEGNEIPYQPSALAKKRENRASFDNEFHPPLPK